MPWFKVDDGWWSHPKTLELSDSAQALWVRAGTWSMKHLTDGFVPDSAARVLRAKPRFALELVQVGLWKRTESGHVFHDWGAYQPTKERVETERAAAVERKRKSRESRRDSHVTDGVSHASPTRPDPTRPTKEAKRESSGGTTGPWCARHPRGTDEPCGACRTARIKFEADERKAVEAEKNKPIGLGPKPRKGDGHECIDDGNGWCPRCQERMEQ
jgi:hypothetical protein